jgi:hypothetical protein
LARGHGLPGAFPREGMRIDDAARHKDQSGWGPRKGVHLRRGGVMVRYKFAGPALCKHDSLD